MVVPVLGRMSDPNNEIRATASNTFASLVKMVPLEVSVNIFYDVPSINFFSLDCLILLVCQRSFSNDEMLKENF